MRIGLALLLLASAAPTGAEEMLRYTVHRGDTLYGLASQYLTTPGDYRTVQRLNHIADPRRLSVARPLTIPTRLLRLEPLTARIEAFSGAVTVNSQPAKVGAAVGAGAHLVTGANAFVTLVFADDTRMTLPSQSVVGIATLNRVLLTGAVDRRIVIENGRSNYSVTPRSNPNDRFEVRTPLAVAAVRGTEFRVGYDAGSNRSTLEVLEGEVADRHSNATTSIGVPANSASLHDASGTAATLLPLPPPPELAHAGRVQDEPQVRFDFTTAGRHRVQLARDAGFTDLFAEADTDASAVFDGVLNGTLFVRATTLASGIEGRPVVYGFERQLNSVEAGVAPPPPGQRHRYVFKWHTQGEGERSYRFVLARDAALTDRLVDAPGLQGSEIAVTSLPPGTYYWRLDVTQVVNGKLFAKSLKVNELRIASDQ